MVPIFFHERCQQKRRQNSVIHLAQAELEHRMSTLVWPWTCFSFQSPEAEVMVPIFKAKHIWFLRRGLGNGMQSLSSLRNQGKYLGAFCLWEVSVDGKCKWKQSSISYSYCCLLLILLVVVSVLQCCWSVLLLFIAHAVLHCLYCSLLMFFVAIVVHCLCCCCSSLPLLLFFIVIAAHC